MACFACLKCHIQCALWPLCKFGHMQSMQRHLRVVLPVGLLVYGCIFADKLMLGQISHLVYIRAKAQHLLKDQASHIATCTGDQHVGALEGAWD